MRRRAWRRRDGSVGASELAQMGRCERLVVLESIRGAKRSAAQEVARQRGIAAHVRFEQEGRRAAAADGGATRRPGERCFIATMVFGDAWQTDALRDFRDAVLRPRPWGRRLVAAYYRAGPRLCGVLLGRPPAFLNQAVRQGYSAGGLADPAFLICDADHFCCHVVLSLSEVGGRRRWLSKRKNSSPSASGAMQVARPARRPVVMSASRERAVCGRRP